MRFFCLRMVSEVTQQFLLDPELYGVPTAESPEARSGIATATIDTLMTGHVLPMVPQLLRDEDPMPLYGLKVCRAQWPPQ
jgi:serine/threonine-protein kinase ULK4